MTRPNTFRRKSVEYVISFLLLWCVYYSMSQEKHNLKIVHKLFAEANYEDALPILESLARLYPNFSLYQLKLQECQAKIGYRRANALKVA